MSYYCRIKKGRIKKGVNKNRGYGGYVIDSFGNKKYIRSSLEFIVSEWLKIKNQKFSVESKIYHDINGRNYKPDFFIYNKNNEIKRIIEVKSSNDEANDYNDKFKEYFKDLNIPFIVFNGKIINKILRKYKLQENVKLYKETSMKLGVGVGYIGSENPNWGNKYTDQQRENIRKGVSWKKYDLEWKKYHKQCCIDAVPRNRESFLRGLEKRKETLRKKRIANLHLTHKNIICEACKKEFLIPIGCTQKYCSKKCASVGFKKRYKNGEICKRVMKQESKNKSMISQSINQLIKVGILEVENFRTLQFKLEQLRNEKLYPNNKPSKENFFINYFGTVDNLNNMIKERLNENKKNKKY